MYRHVAKLILICSLILIGFWGALGLSYIMHPDDVIKTQEKVA